MDNIFAVHNLHRESVTEFLRRDPHLRRLRELPLVYESPLLDGFPLESPGIYALGGGGQVGKTTLVKQLMGRLLQTKKSLPERIHFLSGELVDDHHSLVRHLMSFLPSSPTRIGEELTYVFVDEVTYIKDWDKGIKYLADGGFLDSVWLLVTGSDTVIIREAMQRFPGRRGRASQVDFHCRPLSFREVVRLRGSVPEDFISTVCECDWPELTSEMLHPQIEDLELAFREYHLTGGYLTALNDWVRDRSIATATFRTYADWVRGDVLKKRKNEFYLREVLAAILRRYNTQVSWGSLAEDLPIDHHQTVAEYCAILESMDVLFIQSALDQDRLGPAPKKARKLFFTDPFIHHALRAYVQDMENPDEEIIQPLHTNELELAHLAEAALANHVHRHYPTYYIKAEGEVDIAYVKDNQFWPLEAKWTGQIRPKDLKQIAKYSNGIIAGRSHEVRNVSNVPCYPLPLVLLRFS